jgi:hypothetical protein
VLFEFLRRGLQARRYNFHLGLLRPERCEHGHPQST